MVPTWREKRIAGKENRAADDGNANLADYTIADEDSENSEEIPIDVNMVFQLSAEFCATEA